MDAGGEIIHVTIREDRIWKIGKAAPAPKTINCRGMMILPGAVDCHVHLRDFDNAHKEDWYSGTTAAAAGGITTVLEMPNSSLPTVDTSSLKEKVVRAASAITNYGLHLGATHHTWQTLQSEPHLHVGTGCPVSPGMAVTGDLYPIASLKVYLGSTTGTLLIDDDEELERLFALWKGRITVHGESERLIKENRGRFQHLEGQQRHEEERSRAAAVDALKKILGLAEAYGRNVHICHISTEEEIALIAAAKSSGLGVTCEVAPHHLFLNRDDALGKGNLLKVNPPLREPSDCRALWNALLEGTIDLIATDHAPHLKQEKDSPYEKAPAGLPGLETLLPLVITRAREESIPLTRVSDWLCRNPVRIFGLGGRGSLQEGYAADLVIIDPEKQRSVRGDRLFTRCKWSPFEGRVLSGWPAMTIVAGKIVFKEEGFS